MIGLGSNRLTVCRRGGMSVTQAGRGGMEWLAGGRGPSWSSPYSDQATAALKAQFSLEQWATIRDYGFSHPEIVGYMNAYAPEDAKIAYSLVPTLNMWRLCVGDGTAIIRTGITFGQNNYNKIKFTLEAAIPQNTSGNWEVNGLGGGNPCFYVGVSQSRKFAYGNGSSDVETSSATAYAGKMLKYVLDTTIAKFRVYNGNTAIVDVNTSVNRPNGSGVLPLYCWKNYAWNSGGTPFKMKTKTAIYEIDGEVHQYIPFKRNNEMGLLDLYDGTFYKQYSSGSFSESITSPS